MPTDPETVEQEVLLIAESDRKLLVAQNEEKVEMRQVKAAEVVCGVLMNDILRLRRKRYIRMEKRNPGMCHIS
ncbi:hypothetical protein RIF29_25816 [Crotalaria pallida]|uniref:Uncharacterized protein n=1 Tax=Crotalaria pallida TaxID=3830 RepID=A0AAN9EPG3_CROPI